MYKQFENSLADRMFTTHYFVNGFSCYACQIECFATIPLYINSTNMRNIYACIKQNDFTMKKLKCLILNKEIKFIQL